MEFFIVLANLFTASLYLFVSKCTMPKINLQQKFKDRKVERDFLSSSSLILEILFNVCEPIIALSLLNAYVHDSEVIREFTRGNQILSSVQVLCVFIFIFMRRIEQESSLTRIKCVPKFCYICGWMCFLIMPLAIIGFNVHNLCSTTRQTSYLRSYAIYSTLTQSSLVGLFMFRFYWFIEGDMSRWRKERSGYITLFKRGKSTGNLLTDHIDCKDDEEVVPKSWCNICQPFIRPKQSVSR